MRKAQAMLKRLARSIRRFLVQNSSGLGLIEIVISVALLGVITASIPPALILITNNQSRWNEQRTAENLARNEIEYIKVTSYIAGNSTNPQPLYGLVTKPPDQWLVQVLAQPIDPLTMLPLPSGQDQGIQKITVTISHVNKSILTTSDYKVNRVEIWRPPV